MKTICFGALLSLLLVLPGAQATDNMQAFPAPEAGMARHVLHLPNQANESDLQVELLVGKTVRLDEANRYFFGGKIERETIPGWGFTRYLVRELGPLAGTRMAVDPDAPQVGRFITLGGEPYLLRYNSRLPIVIYVPEGVAVRYRIWRADEAIKAMEQG